MARHPRDCPPGSLQHVIARFANREFRLIDDQSRADYLDRMGPALRDTDWKPLCYAQMSSHLHHAMIAGRAPAWSWLKPLHTGFAAALNRTEWRLGPVFAERPRSVGVPDEDAARLIAYIPITPYAPASCVTRRTPRGPRTGLSSARSSRLHGSTWNARCRTVDSTRRRAGARRFTRSCAAVQASRAMANSAAMVPRARRPVCARCFAPP